MLEHYQCHQMQKAQVTPESFEPMATTPTIAPD